MPQFEPFWLKRTHTILLAGHGAALVLLANIFSNEDDSLVALRENIVLFIPFILGVGFLTWTAFRGIKLDTYKSALNLRDTLEESKVSNEGKQIKLNRLQTDIEFIEREIADLSTKVKSKTWASRYSLYCSAFSFCLGIVLIGFGNHIFSYLSCFLKMVKG